MSPNVLQLVREEMEIKCFEDWCQNNGVAIHNGLKATYMDSSTLLTTHSDTT